LTGCVSHRGVAGASVTEGLDAYHMLDKALNAYLLFNVEPEADCSSSANALAAVTDADFVVNFTSFASDATKAYSDVLLPIAAFTETAGSYVNAQGTWQNFSASVLPKEEVRPGWKVVRVLGNLFEVDGFDFVSVDEVRAELQSKTSSADQKEYQLQTSLLADVPSKATSEIERIGVLPMYSVDSLVRRSQALQATKDISDASIIVSPSLAKKQGLKQGATASVSQNGNKITLPVIIDEGVADNSALVAAAINETSALADSYGSLEITTN